jgi:hypothetical protein
MIIPAFIESLGPVKPRYPAALALEVARELCAALKPHCEKLIVAGSLRRRKKDVGDLEILFLPKFEKLPLLKQADLLSGPAAAEYRNLADAAIDALVRKPSSPAQKHPRLLHLGTKKQTRPPHRIRPPHRSLHRHRSQLV